MSLVGVRGPQRLGRSAAVLVLLVGLVGLVGARRAAPAHATPCTAPSVAVVVDFGNLGRGVEVRCVSNPHDGLAALESSFAPLTMVARQPAFVCRVAGLPIAEVDPCRNTPPSTAYWAYFHAKPGDTSWTYASGSAGGYHPPPGGVEGWRYGDGAAPALSVRDALPAPAAPSSSKTHPATPTGSPTASVPARSATGGGTAPTSAAPTARGSATTSSTGAPPDGSSATAPPATDGATTGAVPTTPAASRLAAATESTAPGGPARTLAGGGLLAVLGLGAWYLTRRRSRGSIAP